jgi:hypothetical protein
VVCSINITDSNDFRPGERVVHLGSGRFPLRERVMRNDSDELPPIANAEWLRADPQFHQTAPEQRKSILARSGSNLILDGRGDPSTLRPFGGILTEVNSIGSIPPHQTARNVELLHFCSSTLTLLVSSLGRELC